jgi:hypothetical protein
MLLAAALPTVIQVLLGVGLMFDALPGGRGYSVIFRFNLNVFRDCVVDG